MSTIPAAILTFRIGGAELSGAIRPALDQIKNEAKAASQQIAEQWRVMAAQIRASTATEAGGTKEIVAQRQQLIGVLNSQISAHANLANMTKSELANYKAITLELERQTSFLKGTGGLTAGTGAFIGQLGGLGGNLISQLVGRLGANLFGVAGGSQLGFAAGGAATSLFSGVEGSTVAIGGLVAGLTALGVAAGTVTINLAKQNEQFEITAEQTGLSSKQVQVFTQLSKEMGLEMNGLVTTVDRFQAAMGEYVRKTAEGMNTETLRTVDGLKRLGIQMTDTSGKLRPGIDILEDLSDALQKIPDASTRSAVTLDILGVRGRELAPYLLSAKGSLRDLVEEMQRTGPIIDSEMSVKLDRAKTAWDFLTREMADAALKTKELIASGFLSLFPNQFQTRDRTIGQFLTPPNLVGLGAAGGVSILDQNAKLLQQAEVISKGGQQQFDLEQKRKELAEAIKQDNGAQAVALAEQVKSLEKIIAQEKERAEIHKKEYEELTSKLTRGAPNAYSQLAGGVPKDVFPLYAPTRTPLPPQTLDQVLNNILGLNAPPNFGIPTFPGGGSPLAGLGLPGIGSLIPDKAMKDQAFLS